MAREEEIADIKAKIKARAGRTGFAQNVIDLRARLAELEEGPVDE